MKPYLNLIIGFLLLMLAIIIMVIYSLLMDKKRLKIIETIQDPNQTYKKFAEDNNLAYLQSNENKAPWTRKNIIIDNHIQEDDMYDYFNKLKQLYIFSLQNNKILFRIFYYIIGSLSLISFIAAANVFMLITSGLLENQSYVDLSFDFAKIVIPIFIVLGFIIFMLDKMMNLFFIKKMKLYMSNTIIQTNKKIIAMTQSCFFSNYMHIIYLILKFLALFG